MYWSALERTSLLLLKLSRIKFKLGESVVNDENNHFNVAFKAYVSSVSDHFKIDRDSGVVSVAKSIANGEDEYLVEIMAEDSGTPSLNSTYQLVINVIDVNLNAPVFENLDSNTEIVVPEVCDFKSYGS